MASTPLRATLALVLAAFTAACGDDGATGPSFSDSVTTVEATGFGEGAASTATYLAANLNFGTPSIAASQAMYTRIMAKPEVMALRARMVRPANFAPVALSPLMLARPAGIQLAEGCTFSGHGLYAYPDGPPVDLNENGIPDDAAIDVVCTQTEAAGGDTVFTLRSEQHVAIKEIEGSIYGMNLSYHLLFRISSNHGYLGEEQLKQSAKIDLRSSTASTDQAMEYSGRYREGDFEGAVEGAGAEGQEWGADFNADATIVYGDPLPDGDLNLHGRSYGWSEPDGRNLQFTIATPTVLAYSAACAAIDDNPPFTAGVLLGRLNNSASQASFEVTFTGCGTYTIAVDNANDPATIAGR